MALPRSRKDREYQKFVDDGSGNTAIRAVVIGGGGGASPVIPNTFYVSKATVTGTRDGSANAPFEFIQDALDAIGVATNLAEFEALNQIIVLDTETYNEALTWYTRRIQLIGNGCFITGGITLDIVDAEKFGSASYYPEMTLFSTLEWSWMQQDGDITVTSTGGATTGFTFIMGCYKADSSTISIASNIDDASLTFYNTEQYFSVLDAPAAILSVQQDILSIDTSVDIRAFYRFFNSDIYFVDVTYQNFNSFENVFRNVVFLQPFDFDINNNTNLIWSMDNISYSTFFDNATLTGLAFPANQPSLRESAVGTFYDNGGSGLTAENVQAAIDELASGGGGNVSGPGSSVDNTIVRWDGVTGTLVQDSNIVVTDNGGMENIFYLQQIRSASGDATERIGIEGQEVISSNTHTGGIRTINGSVLLNGSASQSGSLISGAAAMGGDFFAQIDTSGTVDSTVGTAGSIQLASGTVAEGIGVGGALVAFGGAITDAVGHLGWCLAGGGAVTITRFAAFEARNAFDLGGGFTLTDQYGLYIYNLTSGTNNYGIYIEGASTNAIRVVTGDSQFGGDVYIDGGVELILGGGGATTQGSFGYSTVQSPDALVVGMPEVSRIIHICDEGDIGFDWLNNGVFVSPHPIFIFHTANQQRNEFAFIGMQNTTVFNIVASDGDNADGTTTDDIGIGIRLQAGDGGSATTGNDGGSIRLETGYAQGTGDNDGGSILLEFGTGTGLGRPGSFYNVTAGDDIRFQMNTGSKVAIVADTSFEALTLTHDNSNAVYEATLGGHEFLNEILLPDGSLANPSLTFTANSNKGLYAPSINDISVVADYIFFGGDNAAASVMTVGPFASELGFYGSVAVTQQVSGADLTNNVTAGGTDDEIADYSDLTVYANDAATIRDDIYQLARKLKQVNDGLRAYGLLS